MVLFEHNPDLWVEVYVLGREIEPNSGMIFGREVADCLERGDFSGDPELDAVLMQMPSLEIRDKAFTTTMRDGKDSVIVKCKPDTMSADMRAFKEYKTGTRLWTQRKVDEDGQITFYSTGMFLEKNKVPNDIELIQAVTEKDGNVIRPTGELLRFRTVRTTGQCLNMLVRMKKNARLMSERFAREAF